MKAGIPPVVIAVLLLFVLLNPGCKLTERMGQNAAQAPEMPPVAPYPPPERPASDVEEPAIEEPETASEPLEPDEEMPEEVDIEDVDEEEEEIALSPYQLMQRDLRVANGYIQEATLSLDASDLPGAIEAVEQAQSSVLFVAATVPSAQARQDLERAVVAINEKKPEEARAAIEAVLDIADQVQLAGTARSFRTVLTQAADHLVTDSTAAIKDIKAAAQRIADVPEEELADRIGRYLRAAEDSLEDGSVTVGRAQLKEAGTAVSKLGDIVAGKI